MNSRGPAVGASSGERVVGGVMPRLVYTNPPIQEAICQVRFDSSHWDLSTPGRLLELVKSRYDGVPEQLSSSGIEFSPGLEQQTLRVVANQPGIKFVNSSADRVLVVQPDSVSIHRTGEYEGWEYFRPQIEDALSSFAQATNVQRVVSVGIRYVNRISIPQKHFDLSNYFVDPPSLPAVLESSLSSFLSRVEGRLESRLDVAKVFGSVVDASAEQTEGAEFIIDIDVRSGFEEYKPFVLGDVLSEIDACRAAERDVFEAAITDSTRALFR